MRTGTLTVRAPPLTTSAPAMMSGRRSRTASRTFSLWRSQSRAPRENNSYQPLIRGLGALISDSSTAVPRCALVALLLRQEGGDVVQGLFGAVFVVAVFADQALLYGGDLLARFIIRTGGRSDQPQDVAAFLEQVLLDRFMHAGVTVQRELLAGLESDHGLAHDFLAERLLAGVRNLDLLFDRTQEALVGRPCFAGDGVGDLALIQGSLDFVEILLQ